LNIIIIRCYCYIRTPLFNTRKKNWCLIWFSCYSIISYDIYWIPGCRICRFFIHYKWWSFWVMFLLRNRFPWDTRYDRYCIYRSGYVTCTCLPRYRKPSLGIGVKYTLLTFCGCCVTIPFYLNILLRFLINTPNTNKDIITNLSVSLLVKLC